MSTAPDATPDADVPEGFLAEDEDGKLVVVDGLQRIMTLKRFDDKDLQLELENPELNGR